MIDNLEATLNRLVAFSSTESSLDAAVDLQNIALALEAAEKIPVLTETCMSLCVDLLENTPLTTVTTYSILMLLARCCMREENKELASRFGVFGLCVLILQDYKKLSKDTLFASFDLISTLAMNDGNTRRMMRPAIPHVINVMRDNKDSLKLAFGGAAVISTLTMLDVANAILAAECECFQLLINFFLMAYEKKKQLLSQHASRLSWNRKEEELLLLCDNVIYWTRDALQKLVLAPSSVIDEKLEAATFGDYGTSVEVDELKWKLKFDRKKVKLTTP
ncbi:uncharacterized protein TM35_000053200 [Trypanosoma theileri]|uniref:Uncharacterized protein n=1 Tax=Trypanosoma theileri TaxID=67003 RepID=A0A1X0P460_9TRYP|nr:uncharacterized protein TM35_000053200 [Trypanosoma theileri]ORC91724.1 hypothetical protein TM35_000053200 [Trypanosoma theileri]